jgi:hypothetical protein
VLTPDDEQFEKYLKEFRPIIPDALPLNTRERPWPRYRILGIWSAAAATAIILALITVRTFLHRDSGPRTPQAVNLNVATGPLTMHDANVALAAAPSYKTVLDEMAFHPQRSTVPNNKQSALAVLSKEKIKL